jgi:hypothetical protein
MLVSAYKAGDTALAEKISSSVKKDVKQQLDYIAGLDDNKQGPLQNDVDDLKRLQMFMQQIEMQFKNPQLIPADNTAPIKTQGVTPAKPDSPKK